MRHIASHCNNVNYTAYGIFTKQTKNVRKAVPKFFQYFNFSFCIIKYIFLRWERNGKKVFHPQCICGIDWVYGTYIYVKIKETGYWWSKWKKKYFSATVFDVSVLGKEIIFFPSKGWCVWCGIYENVIFFPLKAYNMGSESHAKITPFLHPYITQQQQSSMHILCIGLRCIRYVKRNV